MYLMEAKIEDGNKHHYNLNIVLINQQCMVFFLRSSSKACLCFMEDISFRVQSPSAAMDRLNSVVGSR